MDKTTQLHLSVRYCIQPYGQGAGRVYIVLIFPDNLFSCSNIYEELQNSEISSYDRLPQECAATLKNALSALVKKLAKYEEAMMGNKITRMCRYLDRRLALKSTEKKDAELSIKNIMKHRFPDTAAITQDDTENEELDELQLFDLEESNDGLTLVGMVNRVNEEAGAEPVTSESEIDSFLREQIPAKTDIMEWWRGCRTKYPNVAKLAKDYLSVMPSSVPAESLFSHAKYELDGKELMHDDLFQAKIELSSWSKFLTSNTTNSGGVDSLKDIINLC